MTRPLSRLKTTRIMIQGMRVKASFVAAFVVPCTPPAGAQVALIYPAPGATAIPDSPK